MVAAWMSADTGVGPSMASASHGNSGIWADLPATPTSSSRQMAVMLPAPMLAEVGEDGRVLERVCTLSKIEEDGEQEADVADPVVDEGLLAGAGRRVPGRTRRRPASTSRSPPPPTRRR